MNDYEVVSGQPVAPPAFVQLAVMVNDGSGSMQLAFAAPDASLEGFAPASTKAAAVDAATRDLLARMKASASAANFWFSFVSFNDTVTDRRPPERLLQISTDRSYDPTAHGVGGTAIHSGLAAAASIVEEFMSQQATEETLASAVVVVMSDGEERDDPVKTAEAATRLREMANTQVAACLFATDGQASHGEPLLESIVSEPRLYQRVYNTEQLRAFFHASVTTAALALPAPRG
jgi:uncharacterized protein YegL